MRLIITRHGETEENVAGILQGHLPGTLSARGIDQAEKVALRLQDEKIDCIYASDLARAADTAKAIAKYHPNIKIEFTEALRERNLGEIQGRKKRELGWDRKDIEANLAALAGGETLEAVYKRAECFLDKIIRNHPKESILLVGHSGIGKALVAVITGKSHTEMNAVEKLRNTSVSIFGIDEDKNHQIVCYNCTAHL